MELRLSRVVLLAAVVATLSVACTDDSAEDSVTTQEVPTSVSTSTVVPDTTTTAPATSSTVAPEVEFTVDALGVSPDQVRERVASLNDSELARINRGIDSLNAGGDSVLGILLVIFIVFVITDVLGATNIFPFIHPVN